MTNRKLKHVKAQIELVADNFTPLWKWRIVGEGKASNGLEEGETGPREMSKLDLATRKFLFSDIRCLK